MAESTAGVMLCVEAASNPKGEGEPVIPEDLGKQAAIKLLEEFTE